MGEVAGDGEDGGGQQVAVADPVAHGQAAQGRGEEAGGEGVAGAHGGDHVHAGGRDRGDLVRRRAGRGGVGAGEDRRTVRAALDDEDGGFREGGAQGLGSVHAPGLRRLVLADEHHVGAACQVAQDPGALGVSAPEAGAVVDVEGHQGPAGALGGERAHQRETVGGERGGDTGEVEDAAGEEGVVRGVRRGHRGGGGPGAVVGDLVVRVGAVGGGAEVDAGGAVGVAVHDGGVDAVSGDGGDEVVAEAVVADPADPGRPVPGPGQGAGDVGLGAADSAQEAGYVGEAAGPGGVEGHHRLAEADDLDGAGGTGVSGLAATGVSGLEGTGGAVGLKGTGAGGLMSAGVRGPAVPVPVPVPDTWAPRWSLVTAAVCGAAVGAGSSLTRRRLGC